jgi:hypothetical protein
VPGAIPSACAVSLSLRSARYRKATTSRWRFGSLRSDRRGPVARSWGVARCGPAPETSTDGADRRTVSMARFEATLTAQGPGVGRNLIPVSGSSVAGVDSDIVGSVLVSQDPARSGEGGPVHRREGLVEAVGSRRRRHAPLIRVGRRGRFTYPSRFLTRPVAPVRPVAARCPHPTSRSSRRRRSARQRR